MGQSLLLRALLGYGAAVAAEEPLSNEARRVFLLNAAVVKSRPIGKGVTQPWRLTLSDGSTTHDAAFQSIDERRTIHPLASGRSEVKFVDSYHYNIAAFELAELLGLHALVPVTVERFWRGSNGALAWWVDAKWDELERSRLGLNPPDVRAWNRQLHNARVLTKLVHDTDRNLGNMLITEDWKLWMIDFTRAFRLWRKVERVETLWKCDRELLSSLKKLDPAALMEKAGRHLTRWEVEALMARRDIIVAHFEKEIAKRGEDQVLY